MNEPANPPNEKRRYIWPWIVAAMVMLGILIVVMSVRQEAARIKEQRDPQMPASPR